MQRAAVEDLPRLHLDEFHEIIRLLHRIARDGDALQHRVLEYVIREHDALGHLLRRRIEIVEIARCVDGLAVLVHAVRREHVTRMHGKRCLGIFARDIRRTIENGIDDGLPLELLHGVRDDVLGRARFHPIRCVLIRFRLDARLCLGIFFDFLRRCLGNRAGRRIPAHGSRAGWSRFRFCGVRHARQGSKTGGQCHSIGQRSVFSAIQGTNLLNLFSFLR